MLQVRTVQTLRYILLMVRNRLLNTQRKSEGCKQNRKSSGVEKWCRQGWMASRMPCGACARHLACHPACGDLMGMCIPCRSKPGFRSTARCAAHSPPQAQHTAHSPTCWHLAQPIPHTPHTHSCTPSLSMVQWGRPSPYMAQKSLWKIVSHSGELQEVKAACAMHHAQSRIIRISDS